MCRRVGEYLSRRPFPVPVQFSGECVAILKEFCGNRPVLMGLEAGYLLLPLHDHAKCNCLHPAGTEPLSNGSPEVGTHPVTNKTVHYPSCLLGVDKVHVYAGGGSGSGGYRVPGDGIESYPFEDPVLRLEQHGNMPADCLSLAVGVGGE